MANTKEKTITLRALRAFGVNTWSRKSDTPRGVEDVGIDSLKPGDKVVIDNYFYRITR